MAADIGFANMAMFEVEGKDGRFYEIEADSLDQAFETADLIVAEQSNSPVTPPEEEGGGNWLANMFGVDTMSPDQQRAMMEERSAAFIDENKDVDRQALSKANAFMQGATDTASAGIAPAAERLIGGGVDWMTSKATGNNREMGYPDFVDRITKERNAKAAEHPGFSTAGGLAGGLLFGLGLNNVGTGLSATGRVLGAAPALGAGEALSTAAGRGDLSSENALAVGGIGALAGAGGQLLGEGISALGRFAGSRTTQAGADTAAKRRIASSLMDDATGPDSISAAINRGKGLTEAELRAVAQSTGGPDGRHLGEYNPLLRELYGNVAQHSDVTGRVGPTVDMANQRLKQLPEQASTILDDALTDTTRGATGEAFKAATEEQKAAASAAMKEIFDSEAGRGAQVVSKVQLRNRAAQLTDDAGNLVFDRRNMTPAARKTLDHFRELAKNTGSGQGLSMTALQQIKFELDDAMTSAWSTNATSADKVNTGQLKALKNMVNDLMGEIDPRYVEASSNYADAKSIERAADRGRALIKGTNNTAPLPAVRDYVETLSGPELEAAQDAALDYLQGQLKSSNTTLRKMAADNPDLMGRVSAIFGDDVPLDELSEALGEVTARQGDYAKMAGAEVAGVSNAIPKGSEHTAENWFDAATTALGLAPGRGAPVSAARRTIARLTKGDPTAYNRNLLELLQQNAPDKAMAALEELFRLRSAPNASMLGGAVGGAAVPGAMSTYGE